MALKISNPTPREAIPDTKRHIIVELPPIPPTSLHKIQASKISANSLISAKIQMCRHWNLSCGLSSFSAIFLFPHLEAWKYLPCSSKLFCPQIRWQNKTSKTPVSVHLLFQHGSDIFLSSGAMDSGWWTVLTNTEPCYCKTSESQQTTRTDASWHGIQRSHCPWTCTGVRNESYPVGSSTMHYYWQARCFCGFFEIMK